MKNPNNTIEQKAAWTANRRNYGSRFIKVRPSQVGPVKALARVASKGTFATRCLRSLAGRSLKLEAYPGRKWAGTKQVPSVRA